MSAAAASAPPLLRTRFAMKYAGIAESEISGALIAFAAVYTVGISPKSLYGIASSAG